jgi:hypothetical protein
LENKHTFTLGQFFKIVPNLRQYLGAKLAFTRKTLTALKLNPIIASVAIDPHMVVIQV